MPQDRTGTATTPPLPASVFPVLFDAVVDRAGAAVVVFDDALRISFVSDETAQIWGGAPESHLGRRLRDVAPGIAEHAEPLLRRALETGESTMHDELVWESPIPPHLRRYWLGSYVPFGAPDGQRYVASVHVETTETRRAHEHLRRLLDALPTFVGLCSPEGVVIEANDAALVAGELRRDEVLGRPLWELDWFSHDPGVQGSLRDAVTRAQQGELTRFDVQVRVAGSALHTIDFQLVPIVEHDVVTALVPSALDISERVAERDRLEALAALSRHLNRAMTTTQVSQLAVAHATTVVDADFVNVALLDEEREELRLFQPPMDEDIEARWGVVGSDSPRTPFHDVLASGELVVVDRDARSERYPHMVVDTDRVGLDTTASIPLTDDTGAVFGVVGVGWSEPVAITDELRSRMGLLADLCAHALRRAQRTEAQGRLIQELQAEVLATPVDVASLDVAVTYEPARSEIGFGGDWYDVVDLDDHHTALVVGDVAGHGIVAAARMTETKATIRTLVRTAPDRADVLPMATSSLDHFDSGYIATAAVVWVDTDVGAIEWRLAGHVPPVLRTPAEGTRLLPGPHHPPLGMPTEPVGRSSAPFPPGSLLVLYTDGLIERRDEDLDQGLQRLRALVEALPESSTAAEATEAILRELRAGESRDDVAMVIVRAC